MNFHSDSWIMGRVSEHYDEAVSIMGEDRVLGVFYQGSGNYGLDYEGSDVDTKCIVLPSLDSLVKGDAPLSTTHIRANDEHIDFKDIRAILSTFLKGNINFLEILFTQYYKLNPLYENDMYALFGFGSIIAEYRRGSILKSIYGVAAEKYHALEHPYPSRMTWINKFGYDPKQLHHLLRLNEFIKRFDDGESFGSCLIANNPVEHIEVKLGKYTHEDAVKLALESMSEITQIRNDTSIVDDINMNKYMSDIEAWKTKLIKRGIIIDVTKELNYNGK